ncbi:MAG: hypothetical protein MUC97_16230 [Bernardetiaceae bacterium]|nr:hypothetical protein [Bernardetiaceae bacterium]
MELPQPAPTARLLLVDSLRGFALLGILIAHITLWFDGGPLPAHVYQKYTEDPASTVAMVLLEVLFRGKFFGIFSFLFGLSFALQLLGSARKGQPFAGRFAWRQGLLGLIGLGHSLHWQGDILSIYALLGFGLLASYRLPDRWLLGLALALVFNLPLRLTELAWHLAQVEPPAMFSDQETEQNFAVLMGRDYWELLRVNFWAIGTKFRYQVLSGRLFITLGFFLLGLYAGRKQFFQSFPDNLPFFRQVARWGGWVALGILPIFGGIAWLSGALAGQTP